jgi:hypothetical protein
MLCLHIASLAFASVFHAVENSALCLVLVVMVAFPAVVSAIVAVVRL